MREFFAPTDTTSPVDWLSENLGSVQEALSENGLIVLRGFDVGPTSTLRSVLNTFGYDPLSDARWSTPRSDVGDGAFTSTDYPAEQWIVLHSEMSYARTWPRLLLFQCCIPSETGGATTIGDLQAVSKELGEIVSEFHEREVLYIRNFRKGVDIPWQNAFGTDDRDEVAKIADTNGLEIEWLDGDVLRTWQQAQGAISDGDNALWFNQAHLFHPLQLPTETRKTLETVFGMEGIPRNAIFADGEPIPDATINTVLAALERNTSNIDWNTGDIAIIDNMRWLHGRSPFTGSRKVLAAMGRPQSETMLTPLFG